ncbi:hypothetical protein G7046_g7120 [Stylonectria norvegica]|nr:hypothetical protein G7046_g7120 [Stylonectria norvegica]
MPGSEGSRMAPAIQDAAQKKDVVLTKTHYSAFNSTQLLRVLRAKMVMEVFICGSLTNVGVYATALDAAGHGMAITIVEDCCGFRSDARQTKAIRSLIDLTGCEVATYEEVIESIQAQSNNLKLPPTSPTPTRRGDTSRRVTATAPQDDEPGRKKSETREIVNNLTGLRLASDSPSPAAGPQPQRPQPAKASTTRTSVVEAAELVDSPSTPLSKPSKPKEASGTVKHVGLDAAVLEDAGAIAVKEGTADAPQDGLNPEHTGSEQSSSSTDEESTSRQIDSKANSNAESKSRPAHALPASKQNPAEKVEPQTSATNGEPETKNNKTTKPTTLASPTTPPTLPKNEAMDNSKIDSDSDEGHLLQRGLCEGDTDVIEDILPPSLEADVFDKLRDEVQWQRMSHQGGEVPRLVAVQGAVAEDGSMPVYRHPSDESPPLLDFSPTVLAIKAATEKHLGHPLNHVLIQFYRDGNDYISEHSDKTLDIVPGSYIANVSLGAERTMVLRTKRLDKDPSRTAAATPSPPSDSPPAAGPKRQIQRARLPHNSLCRMGLRTNMKWLHAIRQDKRADRDKTPNELAYKGGRISLTFRQIGTFLDAEETLIWGQGATGKTREDAGAVVNGQTPEAIRMLRGFGTENHSATFDWAAHYGEGFDVLHMSNPPRLFTSSDAVVNMRLALMLTECGVNYAKGSMAPAKESDSGPKSPGIKFVDNDAAKSVVHGDLAIMLYLDAHHGQGKAGNPARSAPELAKQFTRFQQGLDLLESWRSLEKDSEGKRSPKPLLESWDTYALESEEEDFLAGKEPSLVDFAVWPILHAMVVEVGLGAFEGLDGLKKYYELVLDKESVKKVLGRGTTLR